MKSVMKFKTYFKDELRRLSAENRDFQRRLLDLSKINETLKFKLNQVNKSMSAKFIFRLSISSFL